MYEQFYGLRDAPFDLTPDPRYVFLTAKHREALANLEYGLSAAKSVTLLIGEAGTGKTTLLQAAMEAERCRGVSYVYLNNPTLTRDEFVYLLATRIGLGGGAAQSKAVLLEQLDQLLRERRARGQILALVIDEAQRLSAELLEEVRLLGNLETPTEKLLPLVLAGQPELAVRLEDPALRQLKQRVSLRCELSPFTLAETAAYIASRIRTAGGGAVRLFTQEAVAAIHQHSSGIARTINVICDNALVTGMALDRRPVDRAAVLEVCRDFALSGRRVEPVETPHAARSGSPRAVPAPERPPAGEPPQADERPAMFAAVSRPPRFSLFARRSTP